MCDVTRRSMVGGVPAENRAEVVSRATVGSVGRSSVSTQTERELVWLPGVEQERNFQFRDLEQVEDLFQLDFVPYRGLARHNAK